MILTLVGPRSPRRHVSRERCRSSRDSLLNSDAMISTAVVWSVPLDTGHKTSPTCSQIVLQPPSRQPFAMSRVSATNATFNDVRSTFKPLATGPCPTDPYMRMRSDMAGACVPYQPISILTITDHIYSLPLSHLFGPSSYKPQSLCHS